MSNALKTSNKSGMHSELSSLQMALAAGLCIAGASTFAQETTTLSTVTVSDSALPAMKVDIAPSAKFTAPLIDTPKTVTVINEEVMKQTGATSLADALKASPGITFGSGEGGNPSGDRPFMRGSDAQSSIFVDGMRDIAAGSREVFNLESVEVIKGSDSAYAGRGGAGGSINLSSKKAKTEDFISGDVGMGTDNYKRATLDLNRKLSDDVGFRLNAMAHDADVPGRNGPDSQRWGIAPTVTFGMGTPTEITLSYQHLQSNDTPDSGVPFAMGNSTANLGTSTLENSTTIRPTFGGNRNNWYGLKARDFRDEKSDLFSASIEHEFSETNKVRNATRYSKSEQDYVWTQPDDSQNNVKNGEVWQRFNSRYSKTTTWQNVTEFTGQAIAADLKHQYAFGLELAREESDVDSYKFIAANGKAISNSNVNCADNPELCTSLSQPNNNKVLNYSRQRSNSLTNYKTETVSLYGFDTLTLTPQWLINAGIRLDSYRTKLESSSESLRRGDTLFNYQLGAVYKLQPNASLYASIGTSTTPGGSGNGQTLDSGISNAGKNAITNADQLKPEKTRSFELGTKWDVLNKQLSLTAALFRNETTNARIRELGSSEATLAGKKVVNGLELGFAGRVTKQLDIFGGYTYMDSEQKNIGSAKNGTPNAGTGLAFPNTPKHSVSLWASYKPTTKLNIGLGAVGQSDIAATYSYGATTNALITKGTAGYVRYDAMASYAFTPNVALQVNVYNLTDKVYYASTYGSHYATLGAGRSAVATLKFMY